MAFAGAVVSNMGFPYEYALTPGPAHWVPTSLIQQQQLPLLPEWGDNRAFAVACLVEAVGVALSAVSTDPYFVVIAAALLGGTFMGISALGLTLGCRLSTGDPRRSVALMTAAFGLGQMIGPTFAGFAHGFGDSFLVPSLAAATALFQERCKLSGEKIRKTVPDVEGVVCVFGHRDPLTSPTKATDQLLDQRQHATNMLSRFRLMRGRQ